jgi:hypothetical protein
MYKRNLASFFAIFALMLDVNAQSTFPEVTETDGSFKVVRTGLSLTIGKDDGLIAVTELGGIKIMNFGKESADIGSPVFSAAQMEQGAPKLTWTTTVDKSPNCISFIQTACLDKATAEIDLDGVNLVRELRINVGSDELVFTVRLTNPLQVKRYAFLGIRNVFLLANNGLDMTYIPTENNVLDVNIQSSIWGYYTKPDAWCFDLVDGFIAVNNPLLKQGIGMVFDFNLVSSAYISNDGRTRGWSLDGGALAPEGSFETSFQIVPAKGLSSIYKVTPEFCAGFSGVDNNITIEFLPLKNSELKGDIEVIEPNGKSLNKQQFALKGEANKPTNYSLKINKPTAQTINKVTVNGISFEQYRENNFRMQPLPMVPLLVSYHPVVPPKKTSSISTEAVSVKREKKALLLFGVYANFSRFDKILDGWKINTVSAIPQGIRDIPPASTIDEYAIIILGDVNIESVRPMMSRLAAYVRNGGVLLVTGGPFAYGCGGYTGTLLDSMLPVESKPFDLRPALGDQDFNKPLPFRGEKIEKSTAPELYWIHKVKVKNNSQVLLKAGELPLLVAGTYDKGKVLVFLGAPLGTAPDGGRPYWDSVEYVKIMQNILADATKEVLK